MTRVLVVDDDPRLQRTLSIALRAHGNEVVTASDGRSAVQSVAEDAPDVVILDLGLPDLDGTEVLRRIRAGRATPEALDPWDEQLAQAGAVVIAARRRFCTRSEPLFRERLGQLGGRPEDAGLAYRSEWPESADGLRRGAGGPVRGGGGAGAS